MISEHLLDQEQQIQQMRERLEQLKFWGGREQAADARAALERMCKRLTVMRRQERAANIKAREEAFGKPGAKSRADAPGAVGAAGDAA